MDPPSFSVIEPASPPQSSAALARMPWNTVFRSPGCALIRRSVSVVAESNARTCRELAVGLSPSSAVATPIWGTWIGCAGVGVNGAAVPAGALIASSELAVLAGEAITRVIAPSNLQRLAAIAFVAIGIWVYWVAGAAGSG